MVASTTPVGEILKGSSIKQSFLVEENAIDGFSLKFATYNRHNTGTVTVQLIDEAKRNILFEKKLDVSYLKDNSEVALHLDKPVEDVSEKVLSLYIFSETGTEGNAVTLWYNNQEKRKNQSLYINNKLVDGVLSFSVSEKRVVSFSTNYFLGTGIIGLLIILYGINLFIKQRTGKHSFGLNLSNALIKYKFLLRQLVLRDFKTKYKRSFLGVLWSFLNPILTMIVQYIVFSTIFKSNIENFMVYLLIGIVLFNFFLESINMGLMSIVDNSSLITKVYIPKYIFPVSRVLSSTINLMISLIPVLIVVLITHTHITWALLLLPFSIVCTVVFCIGISLILSSAMVFFRDTQFLWNVVSMLWMYCTPIFYPESIIPEKLLVILKMNPMYHFIRFSRTAIMEGVSPEPKAYLLCAIAAVVPLIIGVIIFKKTQDKFVLNI
ncbi:ABC transporter permease [Paenibacillus faecis]|uniref:Transport permease protein n=2 Tax=Paenibacillus faecis TaxID=862114 RepID=A0A5D0CUQ2_9BACL|nr:ABC transporter permease [Paenibacillus faecis]